MQVRDCSTQGGGQIAREKRRYRPNRHAATALIHARKDDRFRYKQPSGWIHDRCFQQADRIVDVKNYILLKSDTQLLSDPGSRIDFAGNSQTFESERSPKHPKSDIKPFVYGESHNTSVSGHRNNLSFITFRSAILVPS